MKKIKYLIIVLLVVLMCSGCESWERIKKSIGSEFSGLNRIVNVYSYDGKLIATHEGKIDLEINDSKVLFDLNKKRYVYYNALVEVIEE